MELNKINSLVELFFEKSKEKELINQPFLKWLKNEDNNFLTWKKVKNDICLFSEHLSKNLSKGDRCIVLSEYLTQLVSKLKNLFYYLLTILEMAYRKWRLFPHTLKKKVLLNC